MPKKTAGPLRRVDSRQAEEARHRRLENELRGAERRVAKGRPDRAIRYYRKLLKHRPGDLTLLNRLGDLLARSRRLDAALELFFRVASALARQGFTRRARAIYTKILRFDPGHPTARDRRRQLGLELGLPHELEFC